MVKDLRAITVRNVSYNTIATILVSVIQFITSILLARVLLAEDYGIVGFAQIITNFTMQFCDFGIDRAVIQKKETDSTTLYTAFTLKIILSVLLFIIIVIAAPLVQYLVGQRDIPMVIRVLSCNFLISILFFLPQVTLTRKLEYQKLFLPQTVSVCLSSVFTIFMAYNGFGFWSIVIGSIATNILNAAILYIINPMPLKIVFDKTIAKNLLRFGGNLLLPSIIVFLIINVDNFAIGSLMGAQQLGYYAIAFNWGTMICVLMTGFFHKVLSPTFSRFQHDMLMMKKAYLISLQCITFLVLPINILLLIEGREFLFFVLGRGSDRWMPALFAFQVLCIYGVLRAVLEPVGNVIMGLGKPQLFLKSILIVALIELSLLYPAIRSYGIAGVAIAVTLAYISQYFVYFSILKKEIKVVPTEMFMAIRNSLISAIIMAIILYLLRQITPMSILAATINTVIAIVVYIAIFGVMDKLRLFKEIRSYYRFN